MHIMKDEWMYLSIWHDIIDIVEPLCRLDRITTHQSLIATGLKVTDKA